MNWNQFWKYIELFKKYGVKPLLGIVPDNQDPELSVQPRNQNFWQIMRDLYAEGAVEFAQHGYHHLLDVGKEGILNGIFGFQPKSEFAGLSYDEQYNKINAGKKILNNEGIYTDVWMAPAHSFDTTTLKVLVDLGFKAITDGIALYPYKINGIIFVPQQLWRPRYFPFGIFTICLHINYLDDHFYHIVESHLKSGAEFISFSEARSYVAGIFGTIANTIFRIMFILARHSIKTIKKG
jgi:predicted deacetylase